MPANQPLWLRAVLRVERAIGEPIESAVRSDTYFDLISTTTRVRRKVGGVGRGRLAAMPAPAEPAGRDRTSARVRQQLARMERRLNQLSHDVAELDEQTPRVRA